MSNSSEKDCLERIHFLKNLQERCNAVEDAIRDICMKLNTSWEREVAPPIDTVERHIQGELKAARIELAILRGE